MFCDRTVRGKNEACKTELVNVGVEGKDRQRDVCTYEYGRVYSVPWFLAVRQCRVTQPLHILLRHSRQGDAIHSLLKKIEIT